MLQQAGAAINQRHCCQDGVAGDVELQLVFRALGSGTDPQVTPLHGNPVATLPDQFIGQGVASCRNCSHIPRRRATFCTPSNRTCIPSWEHTGPLSVKDHRGLTVETDTGMGSGASSCTADRTYSHCAAQNSCSIRCSNAACWPARGCVSITVLPATATRAAAPLVTAMSTGIALFDILQDQE